MRCDHEHDDGAYVLGALSPDERAAYERHLATCSFCREAMADIARVPDLLSRLNAAEFAQLFDLGNEPQLPTRHRTRAGGDRVRTHSARFARDVATGRTASMPFAPHHKKPGKTFRVRLLSSAAVVLIVGLLGFGVLSWADGTDPGRQPVPEPAIAMTPIGGTSMVAATVRLTSGAGGTKVQMVCSFSGTATEPSTFRLMAYGPDDQAESMGSWRAAPGAQFSMEGATHFTQGNLARLELVQYDGTALLAYRIP